MTRKWKKLIDENKKNMQHLIIIPVSVCKILMLYTKYLDARIEGD